MSLTPDKYLDYALGNPFMHHNHIQIISVGDETCRLGVKLVHESLNLHGKVHGGLLHTMGDIASGITARIDGREYVTQSTHINYLRNTDSGEIFCDTEVVKRGRTMVIVHFKISDDKGRLLADGIGNMISI